MRIFYFQTYFKIRVQPLCIYSFTTINGCFPRFDKNFNDNKLLLNDNSNALRNLRLHSYYAINSVSKE